MLFLDKPVRQCSADIFLDPKHLPKCAAILSAQPDDNQWKWYLALAPALQVQLKEQLLPGPVRTRKTDSDSGKFSRKMCFVNFMKLFQIFCFFFFKERKVAPKCVTWILWNYSNFFFFFFFLKERKVAPCGRHWRYPDAYLPCPEAPWVHASPWSHPPGAMATSGYTPDGRPHDYID